MAIPGVSCGVAGVRCELELLQDGIMCSVSIIGSGEEGADPGEGGSKK